MGKSSSGTARATSPTPSSPSASLAGAGHPRLAGVVAGKKVAISTDESPIVQKSVANISRFIQALCNTFQERQALFEERGTFIIINLCSMLRADIIYKSFAEILKDEETELKFAYQMVQKLNQILLTTQPLYGLRCRLSQADDSDAGSLFEQLYFAWCHSPIAALSLCFLTNNYKRASEIVSALALSDINLDLLTQIDWLVQLLESSIFSALRMRLLDPTNNQFLLQSLYGLLMILPQSEAYKRLSHRLGQAHKFMSIQAAAASAATPSGGSRSGVPQKQSASGSTGAKTVASAAAAAASARPVDSLTKHYLYVQGLRSKMNWTTQDDDD